MQKAKGRDPLRGKASSEPEAILLPPIPLSTLSTFSTLSPFLF
jgi:hypothetical protein